MNSTKEALKKAESHLLAARRAMEDLRFWVAKGYSAQSWFGRHDIAVIRVQLRAARRALRRFHILRARELVHGGRR